MLGVERNLSSTAFVRDTLLAEQLAERGVVQRFERRIEPRIIRIGLRLRAEPHHDQVNASRVALCVRRIDFCELLALRIIHSYDALARDFMADGSWGGELRRCE